MKLKHYSNQSRIITLSVLVFFGKRIGQSSIKKNRIYIIFCVLLKQIPQKNEKVPEVLVDEADYYIVLDGQQRITSLNIALFGTYTYYKGGKGHLRTNPKSWVTKELYYNLDYYKTNDGDDEHPRKRFCFLTNKEVETGNYFKVKFYLDSRICKNLSNICSMQASTIKALTTYPYYLNDFTPRQETV